MPNNTPPLTPEEWERLEKLGMFPGVWGDYVHHNHEGVCTHPSCLSIRAIRQLQSENALAVQQERERCAKAVEDWGENFPHAALYPVDVAALASQIRKGEKP